MDVSFSTTSFIPLLFFFSVASFLLVHGQLLLPITDTIDIQHHQVHIVHVQKPTVRKFQLFKHRKSWYRSFLPNDTLFSGESRLVYAYRQVITGFAAWLTQEELKAIESMDGFLLASQDYPLQQRTTYTPKFLGLDRAQGMWYDSGYGQGQIIAVIDTGVKPTHPSFGGHAMPPPPTKWNSNGTCYWGKPICNNKLIGAQGFRFGKTIAPLDNEGHGSHCASIAAGNFVDNANVLGQAHGTAAGIASKAHLAIYKAASVGDLLKSIDEAIRNHVDVMSISQGDLKPDFDVNRIVIGSFAAITKDIVTCAAAPNDPRISSIDNDAPWIITIGAASTDRRITATVKLGDGREFNGESAYQPSNYNSPQLPLVKGLTNVKGKIVLNDPTNNDTKTGIHVLELGGKALIVMGFRGNFTNANVHVLPASFVNQFAAQQLTDYATSTRNPTAAIIFKGTQFGVRPSTAVAGFSGRGPSLNNGGIIKPNVIAPGVNILAAWPFEIGPNHTGTHLTFLFESGTSMATPHVAGLVALLKSNHPTWSAAAIKSAIMTTARDTDKDGKPILDQVDGKKANVFATGSGLIDPEAANDPGLIYDIQPHDYIRYLCGLGLFDDKKISAIVRGTITCSTIRSIKAEELNYPSIGVSLGVNSTPKTVSRTVTNVGDAGTTYTVDFEDPNGVNIVVSPTILRFNKVGETKSFNITLSFKSIPMPAGDVSEGKLSWVSGKYLARSPIAVTFI